MKHFTAAFSAAVAALLISGFVSQAFATDLHVTLVPERNKTQVSFVGVRVLEISHPSGSSVEQGFDEYRISFKMNGTAGQQDDSGVSQLIGAVNQALLNAKSPAHATAIELTYNVIIRSDASRTIINYKVELTPTLEDYLLQAEAGQVGHIVDLEWRGIVVDGPIILSSPEGKFDVNRPIGLIQLRYPDIAEKFANSQAKEIMEDSLMNFEDFDAPMSSWQFLFDPVGAYGGGVGLQGTEGAKVISVFALGEGSIREGAYEPEEKEVTVNIDGANVRVHSNNPPPSAQIQIAGYADDQTSEAGDFALVTADAPAGITTSTGGFPIQVLLVFGGMMGAIAIFILFKARK